MWVFWILSLIPITVGMILWLKDKEIIWVEWMIGSSIALLTALIFQILAFKGMTADCETWSGWVTEVQHHPRWTETYQQSHTETYQSGTDSKGHPVYSTRTYYTTEYDTHSEHWIAIRDFGSQNNSIEITRADYDVINYHFGQHIVDGGKQSNNHFGGSRFSGDNNIYSTHNETTYICPVTMTKEFENRIKAAPSLFSFIKVPTNIAVYPWPENPNTFVSDRLKGTVKQMISIRNWDIMNFELGATKKVNLIMVGFPPGTPNDYGRYQEAKWVGGKKNDLVICFAGTSKNCEWVYVFGWTEKEIVKRNLESILLNNPIDDRIIDQIKQEVFVNYTIKDWKKFDYITIEPPGWSYWVYLLVLGITQTGLYIFFHRNDTRKLYS